MRNYKMTITVYFRAEDEHEAREVMFDMQAPIADWDSYNVDVPVELHDDKSVGLSE